MKISNSLIEKIRSHGAQTYPEECCGILLGKVNGKEKVVQDVLAIENAREEERERRFLITPDTYLKAEEQARQRGMEILGFYHSHPDHSAEPSQYDLEHAWAWFSYLIVSVERGIPKKQTSWVLREDRLSFEKEGIEELESKAVK